MFSDLVYSVINENDDAVDYKRRNINQVEIEICSAKGLDVFLDQGGYERKEDNA